MRKPRHIATLTIDVKRLRRDGRDRHRHADKAVLIDAGPDDIEPGQAALGRAPDAAFAAAALREPAQGPDPGLDGVDGPKVLLLLVQRRRGVVAEEGEEGGDGEGLVAVGDDGVVDGVVVEPEGEEAGRGVDGDHEEDADDAVGWMSGLPVPIWGDRVYCRRGGGKTHCRCSRGLV